MAQKASIVHKALFVYKFLRKLQILSETILFYLTVKMVVLACVCRTACMKDNCISDDSDAFVVE